MTGTANGVTRKRWKCKDENISDWFAFARENWRKEEGQTMAEYGVVLAVITIGAVARSGVSPAGSRTRSKGHGDFCRNE